MTRQFPKPLRQQPYLSATPIVIIILASLFGSTIASGSQANLLNKGCSQYNVVNSANFFKNLNETFADLRTQLSVQGTYFATAEHSTSSDPVYGMAQCRDYMTASDCVACYDVAVAQIRNCSMANGARVIYDGCFLRYESNNFYDQTTLPGDVGICGNGTKSQAATFNTTVQLLLTNLQTATPKITGYYAATKTEVPSGPAVYAIAQCTETVSQSGCHDCLNVAYGNIKNCPPDSQGRAVDAGCFLRYSTTSFFADNQTTDISSFLGGASGSSNNNKAIIGGVVGGGGALLLILAAIIWFQLFRKTNKAQRGTIVGATELQGPVTFNYKDLKSATKNFSEEYKLGEGGFGDVYKGVLKNGNVVAVKKLAVGSSRVKTDFETEVRLVSNVHHRNLIRLLGCCNKGPELLLVYEYMAKGSLDKYLYGEHRGTLNWKQRFAIIYGTARGLAYLHEQYHVTIIHRDIKSSNILLDDDLLPKICDFGLVRLLPEDQTHVSTRFAGTLGYTAPEYAIHGQLSEKVDTYSFGVVVLEIMSGRRCNDVNSTQDDVTEYLLEQAWKMYESDMHIKLVDEALDVNEYNEIDAKKIIEIALMCTQSPASSRPTMSEVVLLLSERSREMIRPTRPTFIDNEKRVRGESSTSTGLTSTTEATVSFTDFTGR